MAIDYEARIKALGLDFDEALARRLEDIADRHGCAVDVVLRLLERQKQISERGRLDSEELTAVLRSPEPIMIRNRPSYDLKMPWTPLPRRASKRAQRQRERPWAR